MLPEEMIDELREYLQTEQVIIEPIVSESGSNNESL